MENSFFRHRGTQPQENHAFIRKQNPFVDFAVTEFVYAFSEPFRPKRLSVAILALTLPAPEPGEPG